MFLYMYAKVLKNPRFNKHIDKKQIRQFGTLLF